MKKNFGHGFTLIELLVVIAVIAILASVIISSTSISRGKAADSAVKEQLAIARSQAEVFYHNNASTYTNVCTDTGGIGPMVQLASTRAGTGTIVTDGTAQTATTANCYSTASAWAASVKLTVPSSTTYWCVDSTNKAISTTTALPLNTASCS